jgi:hypothetical protein
LDLGTTKREKLERAARGDKVERRHTKAIYLMLGQRVGRDGRAETMGNEDDATVALGIIGEARQHAPRSEPQLAAKRFSVSHKGVG